MMFCHIDLRYSTYCHRACVNKLEKNHKRYHEIDDQITAEMVPVCVHSPAVYTKSSMYITSYI